MMHDLLMITAGLVLAAIADWMVRFYRQQDERAAKKEAEKVLAEHGMSAHLYLATMGQEDATVRHALDRFAFTGYIILDANGNVVGKLVPKVVKGPHLRLVVDNTK